MPPSTPLPEELPLLLPALGGRLVLVVLIREAGLLLVVLVREACRGLGDRRWVPTSEWLSNLPPGTEIKIESEKRRLWVVVGREVRPPAGGSNVISFEGRPRRRHERTNLRPDEFDKSG
jgi:hypothetical protein